MEKGIKRHSDKRIFLEFPDICEAELEETKSKLICSPVSSTVRREP
jgi:hypothetical protein